MILTDYDCRGFGFITFKSAESVRKVLETHNTRPIAIDEKTVREIILNCWHGCGVSISWSLANLYWESWLHFMWSHTLERKRGLFGSFNPAHMGCAIEFQ